MNIDSGKKVARYAELNDIDKKRKNIWLPSIIDKELKDCDCSAGDTCIRPLGLKNSKIVGRKYHGFDIVKDNK